MYLPHLFSLRWCGDFVSSAIIILYLLVNGIRFAFTNGERNEKKKEKKNKNNCRYRKKLTI